MISLPTPPLAGPDAAVCTNRGWIVTDVSLAGAVVVGLWRWGAVVALGEEVAVVTVLSLPPLLHAVASTATMAAAAKAVLFMGSHSLSDRDERSRWSGHCRET
jgi:hypothetical protein